MTYRQRMIDKLTAAFAPTLLEVEDESARHHGHGGALPEGETHFAIRIVAPAFQGVSRLARHRMIHEVVAAELAERVHALSIEADPS
ncbi:BolA family transcriptional regulator [Siculibacillus lacustris]|uniref:BolA family transcriptional regulator n=1 Tax=Siculibacillus lacustris TaxID=1549641 RepID=A0A4V2KU80_9HYPH|nr:BolA family protein [Siculibacillus lacustris]TBW40415.1 BolA family transcriptional regulator [Siculibacillus lacustris]